MQYRVIIAHTPAPSPPRLAKAEGGTGVAVNHPSLTIRCGALD